MSRIELDSARPMYYHLGNLPRPIPGAAQGLLLALCLGVTTPHVLTIKSGIMISHTYLQFFLTVILEGHTWQSSEVRLLALLRNDPGRFQCPYEMLGIAVGFSHRQVRSLPAVLLL